ncbi:carboxymuconolactone decarboxylase family protein [Noviherbaspirillum sp.]|uniref:carboxymuconolactone decarboxylase family protein n=1 Tax=Noviherbaspirillum sp. TaxID=1926288 RepID=UPI002B49440D|nr:carboxymuconolactone decarboxylase family protein [Noviherbaspirillum sp.]HJV82956.1 carboxymuconolactone decarboxylase family protein [Noviherbaspirillum sp.]
MSTFPAAPRIAPVEAPYDASIAEAFARVMPPGREPLKLFRTMARNPRVLQRIFAGSLLDRGTISLRERELVILRTCARCGSEYEWGVHVAFFAQRAGLSKEQVAATLPAANNRDAWTGGDALLIQLVDQLHDSACISDALWEQLADTFTPEQLLELVALTGAYHTISYMTNAFRVALEPDAARFSAA